MAYSIERANLIAQQLAVFSSAYAHHLRGHFANLDFWIGEATLAMGVLDEYPQRFAAMRDAQAEWVRAHDTVVGTYCPHCGGRCELGPKMKPPDPPIAIAPQAFEAARRRLRDAAYQFLLRGHRAGLLDEGALREHCGRVGTGVDQADLDR